MNDRRLKITLAASLAGNLFLVGLIGGAVFTGDRDRGREDRRNKPGGFAAVAEQLDPADAQALRALMRAQSERTEPRVQAIRAAREQVEAAMSRPEYDPVAVRSTVAEVRSQEAALREELDDALIGFAAGLEPSERAAIAPLLRKGARGWRGDQRSRGGRENLRGGDSRGERGDRR